MEMPKPTPISNPLPILILEQHSEPIPQLISILESILDPIPEPIPILEPTSIPEPIPIPESMPIPEMMPEVYPGATIRNRLHKTSELAGIHFDETSFFPSLHCTPFMVVSNSRINFPGKW